MIRSCETLVAAVEVFLWKKDVLFSPPDAISRNSNAEGLIMWGAGGIEVAITQDVSSKGASRDEERMVASCWLE